MNERPRPFTEIEAAEYLRVSPRTLQGWRLEKRGPAFVRLGRKVLYLQSDLDDFLLKNRNGGASREPGEAEALATLERKGFGNG